MHAAFAGAVTPENANHFFGGLVFCFAYERTGSIWPAIALHVLGNGTLALVQSLDTATWLGLV